jgi:PAS domain S-box-containing protein
MGPHRAEANLAALIESTEDLIWSVDLNYGLLTFNRAFHDDIQWNFGVQPAAGMRAEDLLPPARAALWPPLYDRALSEGPFRAEYSLVDGRTLEMAFNRIVQDGETTGISVFGKDITERKTAEKILLDAERRYRDIFEGALEGIYRVSLEGKPLAANPAFPRMLGYDSAQEFLSALADGAHPVWLDPDARPQFFRLLEQHEVVRGYECQFRRKDGRVIWVSVSGRKVCGNDGRALYIEGFIEDITERKRADEKLRESERQLRTVLETISLVGVMLDRQGNITLCNDFLLALSGWKREEVLRRNWFELFLPPEISGKIRQEVFLDTIGTGVVPTHYQNEIITRKGERRLVDWNNTVIRDPGGQIVGVASIGEDITELKRAEAEKARIEDQLRQAQKLESVGRLAAGVAHDFNNLLTVINGYSRLLLDSLKAGDPLRDGLEEIHKAGERAAALTQQLLAFSRKQILQPRVLDLNRVVDEMRPMLARLMGEDVEVCVQLQVEAATICADPHQLEQVLMNLAVNSRDAMPNGGKFSIETGFVEWGESHVQSRPGAQAGPYVMLAVSDTGVGMNEETLGHIFEPFFTTKEVGKGTGLGLSTIHGIVEQSGGYVEADSELGRGTTFKIYMPRLVNAQADSGKPEAVPASGGKETVLVVEDQAEVRRYTATALKAYGYQVIQAENAGEALLIGERESKRIDLILTDVVMPSLSGRELADRLKERWPGIKVLFMSGYTDDTMVHHGVLQQDVEFIQKPFSPGQLAIKVREMLAAPDGPAGMVAADDEAAGGN